MSDSSLNEKLANAWKEQKIAYLKQPGTDKEIPTGGVSSLGGNSLDDCEEAQPNRLLTYEKDAECLPQVFDQAEFGRLVELARREYAQGYYDSAVRVFDSALVLVPEGLENLSCKKDIADALFDKADALLRLCRIDESREARDMAVRCLTGNRQYMQESSTDNFVAEQTHKIKESSNEKSFDVSLLIIYCLLIVVVMMVVANLLGTG